MFGSNCEPAFHTLAHTPSTLTHSHTHTPSTLTHTPSTLTFSTRTHFPPLTITHPPPTLSTIHTLTLLPPPTLTPSTSHTPSQVHTECRDQMEPVCTLGEHRLSILPPSALQRSDTVREGMWEVSQHNDAVLTTSKASTNQ